MSTVDKIQIVSFRYAGESRWRQIECKPPAEVRGDLIPVFDKDDPQCQQKIYEITGPYRHANIRWQDCTPANIQVGTNGPRTLYGWVEVDEVVSDVTSPSQCAGQYQWKRVLVTGLDANGQVTGFYWNFGDYRTAALEAKIEVTPLDPPSDCYKLRCKFEVWDADGLKFSRTEDDCPEYRISDPECPDGYLSCVACCYSCSDLLSNFRAMLSKVKPLNGKTVSR